MSDPDEITGPLSGDPLTDEPDAFDDPAAGADLPPLSDAEAHAIIRRLARIDDERTALTANYRTLDHELETRRDRILEVEGGRLADWTDHGLRGRKRSVRTLHGVAGFRTQPPRFVVEDERRAVEWATASEHRAAQFLVRKFDCRGIRPGEFEWLDEETGEMIAGPPPGVGIVPERQAFYVKSGSPRPGRDHDAGEE